MGDEYIRQIMVLGSVPAYGPVILWDNFESLLKWSKVGTGADYVVALVTTKAYNGGACLHVKTRTTGAAADDVVNAYRYTFRRPGLRYRVECVYEFLAEAALKFLDFEFLSEDGAYLHHLQVAYDPQNHKWQYRSGVATWTDIPGSSQNLAEGAWHRVMFEVDESSGYITKLVSDGLEVSRLELAYYKVANVAPVYAQVLLGLTSVAATPPEAWFDDVLVMEI